MALDAQLLTRTISGRVAGNCRVDAAPTSAEVESDGARLVNASATDLLGLGADARQREAVQAALRRYGAGVVPGSRVQGELEARLAALLGAEAAVVVESVDAVLAQLPTWRFAVEARATHRVQGAAAVTSPEEAEGLLERAQLAGVIAQALHPLSGELTVLPRYLEACERGHGSLVVLDEALGVLGPNGGGAVEHLGLQGQVALLVVAFGAGIPGAGAAVLGPRALVELLRGAAPPPPVATLAGALKAIDLAAAEPARRARVFDVAQRVLTTLRAGGFDTGPSVTPWVPVWLGDEALAERWLADLRDEGLACRAWIAGPRSRLLLSLPATVTDAQVDQVLEAVTRVGRRLGFPETTAAHRKPPAMARPGTYAMGEPAALHWTTVDLPERGVPELVVAPAPPPAAAEELSLRGRVYDAVETLTWKTANATSAQLRRSADAVRALLDRRKR